MADDSRAANVGARYAQALFELAKDRGEVAGVESDLKSLKNMLRDSADLRALLASPTFGSAAKGAGLAGVADAAQLSRRRTSSSDCCRPTAAPPRFRR